MPFHELCRHLLHCFIEPLSNIILSHVEVGASKVNLCRLQDLDDDLVSNISYPIEELGSLSLEDDTFRKSAPPLIALPHPQESFGTRTTQSLPSQSPRSPSTASASAQRASQRRPSRRSCPSHQKTSPPASTPSTPPPSPFAQTPASRAGTFVVGSCRPVASDVLRRSETPFRSKMPTLPSRAMSISTTTSPIPLPLGALTSQGLTTSSQAATTGLSSFGTIVRLKCPSSPSSTTAIGSKGGGVNFRQQDRVWAVQYNRSHDQLLLSAGGDSCVQL
jgi:hypothetical protein